MITAVSCVTILVMTSVSIVDNEKMITTPLTHALNQAGYEVMVAGSGREGLNMARSQILSDTFQYFSSCLWAKEQWIVFRNLLNK